jgi:HD-GYP domain-containing protein (c-di-GMP phosphodiesterase class II)
MPTMRVVHVAHDGALMYRLGGSAAAISTVRRHAGAANDPEIAERFCRDADTLLGDAGSASAWDAVLAAEPGPRPRVSATQFESALAAMGDFADLKSSYTAGHSRRVSSVASAAARGYGLSEAESSHVAWSGLLHDLGRAGVSTSVWDKPGPLTDDEWERVRLHPYFTERVLARSPSLARLGATAGLHHERLDGSGYHRGATAGQIAPAARLLAAADMYCALTEHRAHRAARSADAAASELLSQVRMGRIDHDAAAAVLAIGGHQLGRSRLRISGLSDREIEVLRLLAHGSSNRQIAVALVLSTDLPAGLRGSDRRVTCAAGDIKHALILADAHALYDSLAHSPQSAPGDFGKIACCPGRSSELFQFGQSGRVSCDGHIEFLSPRCARFPA